MAEVQVKINEETEELIEKLFKDARNSARDFKPELHRGRLLDEIDDDIQAVREALDMEI